MIFELRPDLFGFAGTWLTFRGTSNHKEVNDANNKGVFP
jgi:hypothetical protein